MIANELFQNGPVLACCGDAVALLRPRFAELSVEQVEVAHLCPSGRVLGFTRGRGDQASALLPARAIVRAALDWNSHAVVIAHNHPSGDPTPSKVDLDATRRFVAIARFLDIAVLDHLVFTADDWRSLRSLGMM